MPTLSSAMTKTRLANEYNKLCKVPFNSLYRWSVAPGQTAPEVRSYLVTYTNPCPVKTVLGVVNQDQITVRFDLGPNYPNDCPAATIVEGETPFLPNVYPSGNFCFGDLYKSNYFLWQWFNVVGRVLAGDPLYTNPGSPANDDARTYYLNHRRKFPVGRIDFPRPKGF